MAIRHLVASAANQSWGIDSVKPVPGMAPPQDPPWRVLVIGARLPVVHDTTNGTEIAGTAYADLTAALLQRLRPDVVVCPLFGGGFDAEMVIERLVTLGFRGRMRVLCPPLPSPQLVQAELGALAPGIAVTLAVLSA